MIKQEARNGTEPLLRRTISDLASVFPEREVWNGRRAVSSDVVRSILEKVLASSLFQSASRSRALLKFIIEEHAAGRLDRLKEYTIGAEALGRGDSFDPRTDPIVRAEVSRLRGRLERYYATEGRNDPIRIMLPRGSYVPEFVERNVSPTGASGHPDLPVKSQFRERVALAQYFHTI